MEDPLVPTDDNRNLDEILNHLVRICLTLDDLKCVPVIWHYTNIESLYGIIESESIWLSDHRTLNDKNEIVYAKDVIHERYCELHKFGAIAELAGINTYQHKQESMTDPVFVGCFSGKRDKLSQWKGYGSGANGVSIGFNSYELLKAALGSGANLLKVRYHEQDVIPLLDALIETYKGVMDSAKNKDEKDKYEFDYWFVKSALEAVIKKCEWEEEDEYRITFRDYVGNTNYRIANGLIRPYKTLRFDLQKCLCEIVVSDSDPYKRQVIKEYLRSKTLTEVLVTESTLNMRFGV